jgi:hypothetical protein
MSERFAASIASAWVLIDALRDAIETTVTARAKRRLLMLLDALDGELQLLTRADGNALLQAQLDSAS